MDFEAIYNEHKQQVFRICMGYLNDQEYARDLTQEIFIAIWRSLPSFRQESKLSTWIFRIATNHCLRAIENSKRMPTTELPLQLEDVYEEPIEEQLACLYKCIAELPQMERIIISLVLEDLPQTEIALIIGFEPTNTRVKIHRIKAKLTEKFKKYGQFG